MRPRPAPEQTTQAEKPKKQSETSNKSGIATYLFCLTLGTLGVHRYYTGNFWSGLAMTLTAGGLGLWTLYDLYTISQNRFTDDNNRRIQFKGKDGYWPTVAIVATFIVGLATGIPMMITGLMGLAAATVPVMAILELSIGAIYTMLGISAGKEGLALYREHKAALQTAKENLGAKATAAKEAATKGAAAVATATLVNAALNANATPADAKREKAAEAAEQRQEAAANRGVPAATQSKSRHASVFDATFDVAKTALAAAQVAVERDATHDAAAPSLA